MENPDQGAGKGSGNPKGGKGKKWKGKGGVLEGKGGRSPLMRGHPYQTAIRLRLIAEEPAHLAERRMVTVAMAMRPGTTDELAGILGLEKLGLDKPVDVQMAFLAAYVLHLSNYDH